MSYIQEIWTQKVLDISSYVSTHFSYICKNKQGTAGDTNGGLNRYVTTLRTPWTKFYYI